LVNDTKRRRLIQEELPMARQSLSGSRQRLFALVSSCFFHDPDIFTFILLYFVSVDVSFEFF
jgi:hypothetical protein